MSVKKSHKTHFSRKAISMLVWKYQILSKHFLFLFWCLKHVLCEPGSRLVVLSPSGRAPSGGGAALGGAAGRRGCGESWGGGTAEGTPGPGPQSLPRSGRAAPPPPRSGLARPGGGFGKRFPCPAGSESKGGAGSNRKNNSVSQGRQYFSGAQITARQGAPGPERRWPLGPR